MIFLRFLKAKLWDGENKYVLGYFAAWSSTIIITVLINPNWVLFSVVGFPLISALVTAINQDYEKWKTENILKVKPSEDEN